MTSNRVYQKSIEIEEAITKLKKNAGTQFDPQVVSLFLKTIIS
jgi:HD-GYP domain-containing protein (c-di-GMP phosphodiesterase class II)